MHEGDGFQQKLLEKAYFIFKLSGGAVVWQASSDKWKAPVSLPMHKMLLQSYKDI